MSDQSPTTCALCGGPPDRSEYGLVSWTALPDIAWHYECMATPDGADSCPTPWRDAVNGWDNEDVIRKLWGLRLRYEVDDWDDEAEAELAALDEILPAAFRKCGACGGQFSFTSRVRCVECAALLPIDSWFHYSYLEGAEEES
jgi:hypothetical protein